MSLDMELSKTLFRELPGLLAPNNKDNAAACRALAGVLGCQLAYILATRGEANYVEALRAVFLHVDGMARKTAKSARQESHQTTVN